MLSRSLYDSSFEKTSNFSSDEDCGSFGKTCLMMTCLRAAMMILIYVGLNTKPEIACHWSKTILYANLLCVEKNKNNLLLKFYTLLTKLKLLFMTNCTS